MKDLKEGLTSGRKPDLTHCRKSIMVYIARACEYGSAKYERANYLRPVDGLAAAFERLRGYLRALQSHATEVLDAMELHQSLDPDLLDIVGMRVAAYAEDTDAAPGCTVGPSGLPSIAAAAASIMMAIEQATRAGLLPVDPGQPWINGHVDMTSNMKTLTDLVAEVKAEFDPVKDPPKTSAIPWSEIRRFR